MYEITNVETFISTLRESILESYETQMQEPNNEFDEDLMKLVQEKNENVECYFSIEEAKSIASPIIENIKNRNKSIGINKNLINHKQFLKILHAFNQRIVSNILLELSREGLIESGFDEKANDFIFWVKN